MRNPYTETPVERLVVLRTKLAKTAAQWRTLLDEDPTNRTLKFQYKKAADQLAVVEAELSTRPN